MSSQAKTTGSGWTFEFPLSAWVATNNDKSVAADFDPNEPLDFDLIDEINEEENKAQQAEGKDWWKK